MGLMGFDAARDCSRIIPQIQAAELKFVARYYSRSRWKNLTPAEALALSRAGLRLVAVWEAAGNRYDPFDSEQGRADARDALAMAQDIGQPQGSAIYFAVDFDASPDQLAAGVADYFRGVGAVIGDSHKVGAYGSGMVCARLRAAGLASYAWLACAGGWQGTRDFTGWHIRQHLPADPWGFGFAVDPNEAAEGEFGAFTLAPDAATPAIDPPAPDSARFPRLGDSGADVAALQQQLSRAGYDIAADGVFGPRTETALRAFQAARRLAADGIAGPQTMAALGTARRPAEA